MKVGGGGSRVVWVQTVWEVTGNQRCFGVERALVTNLGAVEDDLGTTCNHAD